jgi:hypothetical protein
LSPDFRLFPNAILWPYYIEKDPGLAASPFFSHKTTEARQLLYFNMYNAASVHDEKDGSISPPGGFNLCWLTR